MSNSCRSLVLFLALAFSGHFAQAQEYKTVKLVSIQDGSVVTLASCGSEATAGQCPLGILLKGVSATGEFDTTKADIGDVLLPMGKDTTQDQAGYLLKLFSMSVNAQITDEHMRDMTMTGMQINTTPYALSKFSGKDDDAQTNIHLMGGKVEFNFTAFEKVQGGELSQHQMIRIFLN